MDGEETNGGQKQHHYGTNKHIRTTRKRTDPTEAQITELGQLNSLRNRINRNGIQTKMIQYKD